jgi:hypothetical protein
VSPAGKSGDIADTWRPSSKDLTIRQATLATVSLNEAGSTKGEA